LPALVRDVKLVICNSLILILLLLFLIIDVYYPE
jgi:hypothetical protein